MARLSGAARYLLVTCAAGAYRRAGHAFGKEPVVLVVEDLDEGQLAALDADEQLEIEETDELPEISLAGLRIGGGDLSGGDVTMVKDLQQHLTDAQDEVSRLTKENSSLSSQLSTANSSVSSLTSERDQLQAKLAATEAANAKLTEERDAAITRAEAAEAELAKASKAEKPAKPAKADK